MTRGCLEEMETEAERGVGVAKPDRENQSTYVSACNSSVVKVSVWASLKVLHVFVCSICQALCVCVWFRC